jgi:thymidylate kinase
VAHYILVDGPDGAGKTTLIKKLLKQFPNAFVAHSVKPTNDEEAFNGWKKFAALLKDNANREVVIFDRCWYSDRVYAPIMRGREEMSLEHREYLEYLVKNHGGGIVIHCTGNVHELWRRCQRKGEDYVTTKSKLTALRNAYEVEMRSVDILPVIRYDTTTR